MNVRIRVTGTAPTQLAARVWDPGATEPAAWQVTASDSEVGYQTRGHVGVLGYLSGTATTRRSRCSLTTW
jgi:hypothetical protein